MLALQDPLPIEIRGLQNRYGASAAQGPECDGELRRDCCRHADALWADVEPDGELLGHRWRHLGARRAERQGRRSLHLDRDAARRRSEEHTSELQSLMRISYAVFCLKKKTPHMTTPEINKQSK